MKRGKAIQLPRADERLLRELLALPPAPPRARRWPRRAALACLAALVLALAYTSGRAALALLAIRRNVEAMRIPTVLPAAARPTAGIVPLAPARPTVAAPAPPPAMIAASAPTLSTPAEAGRMSAGTPSARPTRQAPTLTPVPRQLGAITLAEAAPRLRPTIDPLPLAHPPVAGQAITVLLLGIDRRPGESGPARADAIVVARADPERRRVALLSLPRDLIVNIPGYGRARINAATVHGELNPQLGGGVALARETVGALLGIPIDYVVYVDFGGFVGAIDAIGGVDLTVEKELYDPAYPTMDYGSMVAHFLPGTHHMDGATALIYSRMRHMDSDYERIKRQQQVIVAALRRVREQNPFDQLQAVASLTGALRGYVHTDLPMERMADLAWAFRDVAPDAVERYSLDGGMVAQSADPSDPYALYALPGTIESLARQLLYGSSR
jgi:LCP family protein required for cell wall assembly